MPNVITPEENAAMLVFSRTERFVGGYSCLEELKNILVSLFNNKKLEDTGLKNIYEQLKNEIITNNNIGLFLIGKHKYRISDKYKKININDTLYKYIDQNNNIMNLTIHSICYYLIEDYFRKNEILELCKKTPNFKIYYKLSK